MTKHVLAYLFWHTLQTGVAREEYESGLTSFHRELAKTAPQGFLASAAYRVGPTPWLDGQAGYEDWYLIEGSWALDILNQAAVAGAMEAQHATVAGQMATGMGGLYRLIAGDPVRAEQSAVAWLSRPRGIQYEPVLTKLRSQLRVEASVWRRQMVMGPAPEFALIDGAGFDPPLPPGWQGRVIERSAVWLGPGLAPRG